MQVLVQSLQSRLGVNTGFTDVWVLVSMCISAYNRHRIIRDNACFLDALRQLLGADVLGAGVEVSYGPRGAVTEGLGAGLGFGKLALTLPLDFGVRDLVNCSIGFLPPIHEGMDLDSLHPARQMRERGISLSKTPVCPLP